MVIPFALYLHWLISYLLLKSMKSVTQWEQAERVIMMMIMIIISIIIVMPHKQHWKC